MGLFSLIRKVRKYTPSEFSAIVCRKITHATWFVRSNFFPTGSKERVAPIKTSFLKTEFLDHSGASKETAGYLISMYLDHRYNLLGSGWIKNSYFGQSIGLEGHRYPATLQFETDSDGEWLKHLIRKSQLKRSRKIYRLITGNYEPIDWQKDYKTGYRWSQKIWYKKQPIGHLPGVDIKVPWELSRMQHMTQLACFAAAFPERQKEITLEFRNQVLDFIATNPPQTGVNWYYSMEVGIRAANLLVAFDLLKQLDKENILDANFCQILSDSIYDHGKHIINNLEFDLELTTNHYLANISGLVFISAYLQPTPETDFWLSFALRELFAEFRKQFYDDGTNFEASTSYQCLSTAMVAFSSALILGIPRQRIEAALSGKYTARRMVYPPLKQNNLQVHDPGNPNFFPEWYIERLFKSGNFIADISKPNGNIVQTGDNDSGQFFRFSPNGLFITNAIAEATYRNLDGYQTYLEKTEPGGEAFWDENSLNQQPVLSAIGSLFGGEAFRDSIRLFPLEASIIRSMSGGRSFPTPKSDEKIYFDTHFNTQGLVNKDIVIRTRDQHIDFLDSLQASYYKNSGVLVLKSNQLFVLLAAGPNGQNNTGGHAHNDKLCVELNIAHKDIAADPGSYLYTSSSKWRNLFRSISAHPTLHCGVEQNDWIDGLTGLFALKNESQCSVIKFTATEIAAKVVYKGIVQVRSIKISPGEIIISDYCNMPFTNSLQPFKWFSDGYGKIKRFKPDLSGVLIE